MSLKFRNPVNGYVEDSPHPWLWCLLFGVFYFGYKGIWMHVVLGMLAGLVTSGISWLIYPFFARMIITKHYLSKGWTQVTDIELPEKRF